MKAEEAAVEMVRLTDGLQLVGLATFVHSLRAALGRDEYERLAQMRGVGPYLSVAKAWLN